ncbi:hypothetical protein Y032_0119g806 [Ancylostoma ceylanicum]|uniref:Uncharacterized protein n=1 Tax=Ancylostoma ceylanicum TaxID=53326 RepID=A0A016TB18_9BILA|nr:hypothetical protein Y032_0119g806 [Ancylostoma ceylanicum]
MASENGDGGGGNGNGGTTGNGRETTTIFDDYNVEFPDGIFQLPGTEKTTPADIEKETKEKSTTAGETQFTTEQEKSTATKPAAPTTAESTVVLTTIPTTAVPSTIGSTVVPTTVATSIATPTTHETVVIPKTSESAVSLTAIATTVAPTTIPTTIAPTTVVATVDYVPLTTSFEHTTTKTAVTTLLTYTMLSPTTVEQLTQVTKFRTTKKLRKTTTEAPDIISMVDSLDEKVKYGIFAGGAIVLLIFLFCLYRLCCKTAAAIEPEDAVGGRGKKKRKSISHSSTASGSKISKSAEGDKRRKSDRKIKESSSTGSRDHKRSTEGRKGKRRSTEIGTQGTQGTQGNTSDLWTGRKPKQSTEGSRSPEKQGGVTRAAKKMKALLRRSQENIPSAGTPSGQPTASNILDLMGTVPHGSEPQPAAPSGGPPLGFAPEPEGSGGYEEVGPGKSSGDMPPPPPPPPPPPALQGGGMW